MRILAILLSTVAALFLIALEVVPTQAQRWVASNGDNANQCFRFSPCATFQRAQAIVLTHSLGAHGIRLTAASGCE